MEQASISFLSLLEDFYKENENVTILTGFSQSSVKT